MLGYFVINFQFDTHLGLLIVIFSYRFSTYAI